MNFKKQSLFLLLTLLNFGDWGTSGQAVTNWTADVILAKDEGNGNASFTTSKVSSNVSSSSPVNGTLLSERSSRSVTEAAGEPQKTSTIEPAAGHVTMPFTTANTDDEVTKIQPESTTTFDPARRVTTTSTTANIDDVVTEFQPENMATFDPADQVTRTPATANFSNVLTETEPGFYLLNVTACNFNYPFTIIPVRPAQNGVFEARGPVVTSHTNPWSFLCKCQLTPPDGLHLWALVETLEIDAESIPEDDQIFYLSINDDQWDRYDPDTFKEDFVISPSAYIYFSLQSSKNINSFYFRFSFFLIESSEKHKLPVTKITNTTGYITTFAFDGKIRYANYIYFQNAEVTVPAGYFLLVSFPHVDIQESPSCQLDGLSLALYESWQGSSQYWQEWIKCGRENIPAKIYNTSLSVDFSSDKAVSGTGFKMFYSIHPANQQPERLTSGLFNCSVPYFHTFQLHFSCNLATDCVEGEDEMDCPYKSYVCGPHLIDAGSKCLQYIEVGREITWYDAYQQCTDMGKRLVSPRTHTEWGMFTNILTYGKTTRPVFVGLTTSPSNMAAMYRDVWHWTDQTMAFYANMYAQHLAKPSCALVPAIHQDRLQPVACAASTYVNYLLCESDKPVNSTTTIMPTLSPGTRSTSQFLSEKGAQLTWCPGGHMTLDFLSCDPEAQCNFLQYATSCPLTSGGEVPMFECDSISQTFHYTLVCDHRRHCADGSDENFCVFDECPEQQCRNYQCVSSNQWCDGTRHCVDGSDEECLQIVSNVEPSVPPPAVVSLDGRGGYKTTPLNSSDDCPVTHFRCPGDYCLPVYLRCNGVADCPGREDEAECESYTCPGFYRCRASSVCLHVSHVCDGAFQCPQQDDEMLCRLHCPAGCTCQGLAFVCSQNFSAKSFPDLRYLDASGSGMTPAHLTQNFYLVGVRLSSCGLVAVPRMAFPNLRTLDLSANRLINVSMQSFVGLRNLRVLSLSQNPLAVLTKDFSEARHISLKNVDLSFTELQAYESDVMANFPNLRILNVSHGALSTISSRGLNSTPDLEVLDLTESPLAEFPRDLLRFQSSLKTVYASNFKLCCPATLPENFNLNDCHAPMDEIASCDDLLRSNAYRGFLWFMASMAVVGNAGSFAVRVFRRDAAKTSFNLFVTNLSMGDFLMGVYLIVIGAADQVYHGSYLWYDRLWKNSAACKTAGFLSLLSSEVSAFFICLITLDRFLVLQFPFSTFHFTSRSALLASAGAWAMGFILAVIPLLPMTSGWEFYSQTGICIPLPVTRQTIGGHDYAFRVMVALNLVLFVLIAVGQLLIFWSVRQTSASIASHTNEAVSRDATIARRLTTIVLSDFLCWFPIGLLGLLARMGHPIPSEVNVVIVIFVLPFNSALNPFLYTFNIFLERRRQAAEDRIQQRITRQILTNRRLYNVAETDETRFAGAAAVTGFPAKAKTETVSKSTQTDLNDTEAAT